MGYTPQDKTKRILEEAYYWIESVDYPVTARWLFYRLLQEGTYDDKAGYKHLLHILSKARKEFYGEWRPWTLADDTRAPVLMQRQGFYTLHLRGSGLKDENEWIKKLKKELNCPLDRWANQPIYAEVWFEASAMQGQFLHYANENLPLLAFHGDISIPEKWRSAGRLAERWLALKKPIHIYYYGDMDPKGLIIPLSAWSDIHTWATALVKRKLEDLEAVGDFNFHRVGINPEQIDGLNIPENPERPGTYQWEGLDDKEAQSLITMANEQLDLTSFDEIKAKEQGITDRLKNKI